MVEVGFLRVALGCLFFCLGALSNTKRHSDVCVPLLSFVLAAVLGVAVGAGFPSGPVFGADPPE